MPTSLGERLSEKRWHGHGEEKVRDQRDLAMRVSRLGRPWHGNGAGGEAENGSSGELHDECWWASSLLDEMMEL